MPAKLNPHTPVTIPAEVAYSLARTHYTLVQLRRYRNATEADPAADREDLEQVRQEIGQLSFQICSAVHRLLSAADYITAPEPEEA